MNYIIKKKALVPKQNADTLGLMVDEPNIDTRELNRIKVPTLVIVCTKDIIKKDHTRQILFGKVVRCFFGVE